MKRACETCAAWTKNKQNNDGYCFATPRDMVPKENNAETGKDCRCLQWQPRERGTCGDCEFGCWEYCNTEVNREDMEAQCEGQCDWSVDWTNPDLSPMPCFLDNEKRYVHRTRPGCGDWMPKRETTDGN